MFVIIFITSPGLEYHVSYCYHVASVVVVVH